MFPPTTTPNPCTTPLLTNVSGKVVLENSTPISSVEVGFYNPDPIMIEMTEEKGLYIFEDAVMHGNYVVDPYKNIDHENGISTFDLIKIQRHILGIELLDSPYKIIAADINKSNKVNGLDLIELRKLILGKYTEFPNNTSWRFVDAGYKFTDPRNPFITTFPENYEIADLERSMEIDFIGVKIGDINNSVVANINSGRIDNRNIGGVTKLTVEEKNYQEDQNTDIVISLNDLKMIDGFQTELQLDTRYVDVLDIESLDASFGENNMNLIDIEDGVIKISWNKTGGMNDNVDLFKISLRVKSDVWTSDFITIGQDRLLPEAYTTDDIINELDIEFKISDVTYDDMIVYQNMPNPWVEKTVVKYYLPQNEDVEFNIYDLGGKLLYRELRTGVQGLNTIEVSKDMFVNGGLLYYELVSGETRFMNKMLLIK